MPLFNKEMFEAFPMGVVFLDCNDRLMYANQKMICHFEAAGLSTTHLCGQTPDELHLQDKQKPETEKGQQPVTTHQQQPRRMQLQNGNHKKEFEVTTTPANDSNGTEGTLMLFSDITCRHQLEDELLQVKIQSEKLSSLGLLVSGIAHEINNPLTSIVGCSEFLAQSSALSPEQREAAEIILFEARRSGEIVRNLLTFARQSHEEKSSTDINEIVRTLIKVHTTRLQKLNIKVSLDLHDTPLTAIVNITNIQQLLVNLISNSEDAIQKSGVGSQITIRTRPHGNQTVLEVEDDGPGIRPEELPHIFDPFFTTKEVGAGTGLGLSICYGLVREHGGSIEAVPLQPAGTCFKIKLPPATQLASLEMTNDFGQKEPQTAFGRLSEIFNIPLTAGRSSA